MIEQPAESRSTANPCDSSNLWRAIDEFVGESLVISLPVIVLDVLRDGPAKMALAEWHHAIQTLVLMERTNRSAYAFALGA